MNWLLIAGLLVGLVLLMRAREITHRLSIATIVLLIIFFYVSFSLALKGKDINYKSVEGLKEAVGIYFSWLSNFIGNVKTITAQIISMNWIPENNVTKTNSTTSMES